jgi:hypothetical protein
MKTPPIFLSDIDSLDGQPDIKEIAREVSLMIPDDAHDRNGCRFVSTHLDDVDDDSERPEATCWACLAQDKLAEIYQQCD